MSDLVRRAAGVVLVLLLTTGVGMEASAGAADASGPRQESYAREGMGDYPGAIASLERLPEAERQSYFVRLRLGWLHYLAGEYGAAVGHYRAAAGLEPKAIEPLLGLTLPQIARRAWPDVEQTARRALAIDEGNYLATSRLAWALYNQGRHVEAEAQYRGLLVLYPADLEMRAGLAWCLARRGQRSQAETEFRKILAVAPAHPSARTGLDELRQQ